MGFIVGGMKMPEPERTVTDYGAEYVTVSTETPIERQEAQDLDSAEVSAETPDPEENESPVAGGKREVPDNRQRGRKGRR